VTHQKKTIKSPSFDQQDGTNELLKMLLFAVI